METEVKYETRELAVEGVQRLASGLEKTMTMGFGELFRLIAGLAEHVGPKPYPDTRPPKNGSYLVVANFESKYWQATCYTVEDGFGAGDHLVTHWAHLPPLPEPRTCTECRWEIKTTTTGRMCGAAGRHSSWTGQPCSCFEPIVVVPQGTEITSPKPPPGADRLKWFANTFYFDILDEWECLETEVPFRVWLGEENHLCVLEGYWSWERREGTEEESAPTHRPNKHLDTGALKAYCNTWHFDVLDRWECLELEGVPFWDWLAGGEHYEVLVEFKNWFRRGVNDAERHASKAGCPHCRSSDVTVILTAGFQGWVAWCNGCNKSFKVSISEAQ